MTRIIAMVADVLSTLKPSKPFTPCNTGWPTLPAGLISDPGIVGHRKLK